VNASQREKKISHSNGTRKGSRGRYKKAFLEGGGGNGEKKKSANGKPCAHEGSANPLYDRSTSQEKCSERKKKPHKKKKKSTLRRRKKTKKTKQKKKKKKKLSRKVTRGQDEGMRKKAAKKGGEKRTFRIARKKGTLQGRKTATLVMPDQNTTPSRRKKVLGGV